MTTVRSALNAAFGSARDRILDWADRAGRFPRLIRAVFCALVILVAAGWLLEHGAWTREESFSGPFRQSTRSSGLYAINIGVHVPFWLGMRLVHTDTARPAASTGVQFFLDGRDIELPRTPQLEFAHGAAFWSSARQRELFFVLPDGVPNDSHLLLLVRYFVRFHSTLYDAAGWGLGLVVVLQLVLARRRILAASQLCREIIYGHRQYVLAFFPIVSVLVIACCCAYAATIVYGIYVGAALATATVFQVGPSDLLAGIEPYLPPAILIFAALGAGSAWAASLGILPLLPHQHMERLLGRIWRWWGLPVILCFFLFSLSAGGWSGHIRPEDQNYQSLAGLIPHSDARAYFTDVHRQTFRGEWDVLGSRRPLGAAFRELTVFAAGYSYVGTLLVQVCLIAGALYLAASALARRHGIWAAIAFVGFIYITTRSFLCTTLTEPLALIWTLFAIVFLIEAFRRNSLSHALIALAGLTVALGIRLGSLLTIPFLVVWIAISFGTTPRARVLAFTWSCVVVVGVFALNGLLGLLYGAPNVDTNFAWVACGLSIGADWTGCREAYQSQLQLLPHERAQSMFLFARTWENVQADPVVFLSTVCSNFWSYFKDVPRFLFEGYSPGYRVSSRFAQIAIFVLLVCLLLVRGRNSSRTERRFWILLFTSIFLSAAVVLGGDGWRVLHVTHVLVAYFFAAGFTAPAVVEACTLRSWRWQTGTAMIAAMTALVLVVPPLSRTLGKEFAVRSAAVSGPDEHIILGGRHITGFLVLPDYEAIPLSVPALHFSRFIELIRASNWESDFALIRNDALPVPPFAFIMGVGSSARFVGNIYVAPPEVLRSSHVCAWKLTARRGVPETVPMSVIFFRVTAADEWRGAGQNRAEALADCS
jgi:hypothetical protein